MEVHVQHRPSYALAVAQLEPNETIQVEAGSMVGMSAGESFTMDTGHLVPFSDRRGFKVRNVGGLKLTLFSGEGLVVDLTGPGRFWLQTRSEDAFLTWLIPKLPHRESSN
jgi:uncharacterized protein (AIM24 family)